MCGMWVCVVCLVSELCRRLPSCRRERASGAAGRVARDASRSMGRET